MKNFLRFRNGFWLALALGWGAGVGLHAQTLAPNPDAVGLWVGDVTLNQVTNARGGTNAPTQDAAQVRILLHVSTNGAVRLLKDVIVARRKSPLRPTSADPTGESQWMLVTDPTLLPGLRTLLRRGGKLIGQRFASAAYDFDGLELPLTGGIGRNYRCEGTLSLAADHPTNPFRHRYHPEHASGYPITRVIAMQFSLSPASVNGATQYVGDYEERLTGLHRSALVIRGVVTLNRLSSLGFLNQ